MEPTFRLLGSLEIERAAGVLGSGKQRALLAYLLLRRNEAVPRDALIDALWADDPPESAAHALDVYASRLRKVLGVEGLLESRSGAFRLNVADESLDVGRFERLMAEARSAATPAQTLEAADEALALWRGRALADVLDEPFARPESERLEEERVVLCEERFEALLALGRHHETIGELQGFVREHPLRERPRRQLMLALYRAGRQSQALDVYREARALLRDELGLEPSRELRELEAAILRQDEQLASAQPEADSAAPRAEHHSVGRPRKLVLAGVLIAVAGGSAAALLVLLSGGSSGLSRIDFKGVGVVDPRSGRIVSEVIPSGSPGKLAARGDSIWTTNQAEDTVSGIDPSTHAVEHTIPVGSSPSGLAAGGGAVWVADTLDGMVSRIDPGTEKVVQTIEVGRGPTAVAFGAGAVWVTNAGDRTVTSLDPKTGAIRATFPTGADGRALAVGAGALWVVDQSTDRVVKIDPLSGRVVRGITVGSGPAAIVSAFGSIWVANSFDGTVSRIDPSRDVVAGIVPIGGTLVDLAATAKLLWVADESSHMLYAIDPETSTVARRVDVGSPPIAIAAAPTRLWISVQAAPGAHRGGTLHLASPLGAFDSFDPAIAYGIGIWNVLPNTNDGLVDFRRTGGSDSTQLVPDLAVSIPTPEDGGTTYTFELRRDIPYSNGATVTARDFRFVLERDFKLHSPGAGYYAGLVGGAACIEKPSACSLARGVVANVVAGTVSFHLTTPDPEFLDKLALPFADALPAKTTPLHIATNPLPATGPYEFSHYVPHRYAVLVRNPHFHVWSTAAQPQGYPDRMIWNAAMPLGSATTAIEQNRADVAVDFGPPPGRLQEIETRYASQVHTHPYTAVQYLFLNTRRRPFSDVRVRQALNYAIDRNAIVRLQGGTQIAQPTCQFLPPLIPGYDPYCPYTRNPNASGGWTAPDLAKAQALVGASGTHGMRVALWSYQLPPYASEMRYVATILRRLGYRVTIRAPGDAVYYARVNDSRTGAQAGNLTLIADYQAPSYFFRQLSCRSFQAGSPSNVDVPEYCDKATDALVARAEHLEVTDAQSAARVWAQADRRVVDVAPVVPLFVNRAVDLVSRRVGNYQYSLQWGVLIDQLWVR